MNLTLKSKEYADIEGKNCPCCGSSRLVALGLPEIGPDRIGRQPVVCQTCRKEWVDKYRLVGFESLKQT